MITIYCPHNTLPRKQGIAARAYLNPILADLPTSQAGQAVHTCPYCAYEKGFENGQAVTIKKLNQYVQNLTAEPSSSPNRH